MERLTEQEMIAAIEQRRPFAAEIDSGVFSITVREYEPVIATAIHDGHGVSAGLEAKYAVNEEERFFEEDPFTSDFAGCCPISIAGNDSRFMYDLNRPPDSCIYYEAWGKKVWRQPLTAQEKESLLERHGRYYRILGVLLKQLAGDFNHSLLYDLHSYNYKRRNGNPPLFNIGTHYINSSLYGPFVDRLKNQLQAITIDSVENKTACDDVFYGKGYQARVVSSEHPGCLCIPLEIKKVFMIEESGEPLPAIMHSLRVQLEDVLIRNAAWFVRTYCP